MLKDAVVKVEDSPVSEGADILIPVDISDVGQDNVTAYELVVDCDSEVLAFDGIQEAGSLTEGWMEADNNHVGEFSAHKMKIAAADAQPPLPGAGTLVFLKGKVLKTNDSNTVTISGLTLNEKVLIPKSHEVPSEQTQPLQTPMPEPPAPVPAAEPSNSDIIAKLQEISDKIDGMSK